MKSLCSLVCLMALVSCLPSRAGDEGVWRTAYAKRGFVGELGTPDNVIRSGLPLAIGGTKVRVYLQTGAQELHVTEMSLVKAADRAGTIAPPVYAITYGGKSDFKLPIGVYGKYIYSDDITMLVTPGLWYLQQSYEKGIKIPYCYDTDGDFHAASPETPGVTDASPGAVYGVAWRIDVLTKDTRPLIVCYGDSITQGYGATPMSGNRYPELLDKELDQPVLNLGQNGDLFIYGKEAFYFVNQFPGVKVVVFLMGINDIISGSIKSVDDYAAMAAHAVSMFHSNGIKIVWGTIPPATGCPGFSDKPEKEILRLKINEFIRTKIGADAIADFDAALTDPKDPKLLYYAYQKDWLHPNDSGNQVMAQVAAEAVRKAEAAPASTVGK